MSGAIEQPENIEEKKDANIGNNKTPIPTNVSYIGYYADIDGKGGVDGIIFADLAFNSASGWSSENSSSYSYSKKDELKDYYISQSSYTTEQWGEHPVISPINVNDNNSEKNRFYVMQLSDIDINPHYWYKNAYGNMKEISELSNMFGSGEENTKFILDKYLLEEYGEQDNDDVWKLIVSEVDKGWFMPSKAEWTAFAVFIKDEYGLTTSNYSSVGLRSIYWSSSQSGTNNVWNADFTTGYMNSCRMNRTYYCRLATTF